MADQPDFWEFPHIRRSLNGVVVIRDMPEEQFPWRVIYVPLEMGIIQSPHLTDEWVATWPYLNQCHHPDDWVESKLNGYKHAIRAKDREYGRMSELVGNLRAQLAQKREIIRNMKEKDNTMSDLRFIMLKCVCDDGQWIVTLVAEKGPTYMGAVKPEHEARESLQHELRKMVNGVRPRPCYIEVLSLKTTNEELFHELSSISPAKLWHRCVISSRDSETMISISQVNAQRLWE